MSSTIGDDLPAMPDAMQGWPHHSAEAYMEKDTAAHKQRPEDDDGDDDIGREGDDEALMETKQRENKDLTAAKGPQKTIRRRRLWAGLSCLVLIAVTAYCLARYGIAWTEMGSTVAEEQRDSLVQKLSLLFIALSGYSLLLFVIVVLYLRFSRRKNVLAGIVKAIHILGGVVMIALALANLGLVFTWHKYYDTGRGAGSTGSSAVRDVARRCGHGWQFDILWGAAAVARAGDRGSCPPDQGRINAFIIAAVVRLVVFVVVVAISAILLRRYTLALPQRPAIYGAPSFEHETKWDGQAEAEARNLDNDKDDDSSTVIAPSPRPSEQSSFTRHERTPSQERRKRQARHEASKAAGRQRSRWWAQSDAELSQSLSVDESPSMPSLEDIEDGGDDLHRGSPSLRRERSKSTASPSHFTDTGLQPTKPSKASYVRHLGHLVLRLPSIQSGDDGSSVVGSSRYPSEAEYASALGHARDTSRAASASGRSDCGRGTIAEEQTAVAGEAEGGQEERQRLMPGGWS